MANIGFLPNDYFPDLYWHDEYWPDYGVPGYTQYPIFIKLDKNFAGQKLYVYAWNTTSGAPEPGDAANITCQQSIDGGVYAALADTNPAEVDSSYQAGWYVFDLAQTETNGDEILFLPVSSTADVVLQNVFAQTKQAVSSSGVDMHLTILKKNLADQWVDIYAWDWVAGAAYTAGAATITGKIKIDDGSAAAINDTNPTELSATDMPGWYRFYLTQSETNGAYSALHPFCSDADVIINPVFAVTSAGSVFFRTA